LKNEVKKKMMIDWRELLYQSHGERNLKAKVNRNLLQVRMKQQKFLFLTRKMKLLAAESCAD
jgi:hypothetical protein